MLLGRDTLAFQGIAAVSYLATGLEPVRDWHLRFGQKAATWWMRLSGSNNWQPSWFNLDLTATKKFGKMEIGAIAYGSWDLDAGPVCDTTLSALAALQAEPVRYRRSCWL